LVAGLGRTAEQGHCILGGQGRLANKRLRREGRGARPLSPNQCYIVLATQGDVAQQAR
jgi:hypothetical protein